MTINSRLLRTNVSRLPSAEPPRPGKDLSSSNVIPMAKHLKFAWVCLKWSSCCGIAVESTSYYRPEIRIWPGNNASTSEGICSPVCVCYQSLTAHQHQKGHTVPKQVITIATSIQVTTVSSVNQQYEGVSVRKWYKPDEQNMVLKPGQPGVFLRVDAWRKLYDILDNFASVNNSTKKWAYENDINPMNKIWF